MSRLRRALVLLNAIAAAAAAVVLVAAPSAIPAVAGVSIKEHQFLLCYLLAGAELAIAALCLCALRSGHGEIMRITAVTLIVLHISTSAFAVFGYAIGSGPGIWFNIGVRVAIALLLGLTLRAERHSTPSRWQRQR